MAQKFSDAARAELLSGISSSDTSLTIKEGGALFPVANTGNQDISKLLDWFKLVLQDNDGIEIVYVRTHTLGSNTFSDVLRGQDGTVAKDFSASTVVGIRPTAGNAADWEAKEDAIPLGSPNQFLAGDKVWKTIQTYQTGNVLTTARTLSAPDWLLTDGAAYLRSAYPDLAMLFPAMTKLPDPAVLPPSNGNGCTFSPDGTYLSVAHHTLPHITIYKRNGDTFTKLANPSALPIGNGYGCAFSPDGTYLSVSHATSPFVTIYRRSGDTFTKLANPADLPTGNGHGCAFSPDGTYLSVALFTSPFVSIYTNVGGEGDATTFVTPNISHPKTKTHIKT